MGKVIYMEDTIAFMGNFSQMELAKVQEIVKEGEVKTLQSGYRYIVLSN